MTVLLKQYTYAYGFYTILKIQYRSSPGRRQQEGKTEVLGDGVISLANGDKCTTQSPKWQSHVQVTAA